MIQGILPTLFVGRARPDSVSVHFSVRDVLPGMKRTPRTANIISIRRALNPGRQCSHRWVKGSVVKHWGHEGGAGIPADVLVGRSDGRPGEAAWCVHRGGAARLWTGGHAAVSTENRPEQRVRRAYRFIKSTEESYTSTIVIIVIRNNS